MVAMHVRNPERINVLQTQMRPHANNDLLQLRRRQQATVQHQTLPAVRHNDRKIPALRLMAELVQVRCHTTDQRHRCRS